MKIMFAKLNNKLAWNDLQLILAIADAGTLSGAGRVLGASHATIYRRLCAVEENLSVALFDRAKTGYTPTLAGEELSDTARKIEQKVLDVERRVIGRDVHPSGTVRVTTLDSFLVGFLSPIFSDFQSTNPKINLEITVANQLLNLSKREADIAIRPSRKPDESLVGRKVAKISYAVYGRPELSQNTSDILKANTIKWIGSDETMYYPEMVKWMEKNALTAQCNYKINSVVGMHSAARNGHGCAVLPCYLGDQDPQLIRYGELLDEFETDLWFLTHPDLRKTARIRALLDFLYDKIRSQRELLAGKR